MTSMQALVPSRDIGWLGKLFIQTCTSQKTSIFVVLHYLEAFHPKGSENTVVFIINCYIPEVEKETHIQC